MRCVELSIKMLVVLSFLLNTYKQCVLVFIDVIFIHSKVLKQMSKHEMYI